MLEQQKIKSMSLDEFMEQYAEQPFELIDGEIIVMAPGTFDHNTIQHKILAKFSEYFAGTGTGMARMELVYIIEDKSNWVKGSKVPDVLYIQKNRWDEYSATQADYGKKPLILVPDIVFEIVSPNDTLVDVDRKIESYLQDGVKIVWLVKPASKTVAEYTQQHIDPVIKRDDDVLSGGDVAEGFELRVSEIF